MRPETLTALSRIASDFCDNQCRWPRELHSEDKLEEKCAGCYTMLDLVNLVEQLDTHTDCPRQWMNKG
jgi:hypothetical protein